MADYLNSYTLTEIDFISITMADYLCSYSLTEKRVYQMAVYLCSYSLTEIDFTRQLNGCLFIILFPH